MENPFEGLIVKAGGLRNAALALGVSKEMMRAYRGGELSELGLRMRAALEALGLEAGAFETEYEAFRAEKVERLQEAIRVKLAKGGGE